MTLNYGIMLHHVAIHISAFGVVLQSTVNYRGTSITTLDYHPRVWRQSADDGELRRTSVKLLNE